jgi:hypothetical protein
MKTKIEALIKEVEAILNQLKSKSKANVKENLKRDFIELLSGCTISFDSDVIEYRKDRKLLFFYRKNENIFRVKYVIWLKFQEKYSLNHQELSDLLAGIVEEVFNYKDVITWIYY